MKKTAFLLVAVLMTALLAISVAAEPIEYETAADNSFDVTYTGTAGEYYAIVVVEGIAAETATPAITETSIQYIDQKTADATGAVAFNDILLKVDGTASTVYLGGSDLDRAVLLGYVNNQTDEFAVSGTVTSDSSAAATVTLTSTTDTTKVFTVNTVSGAYTITVPADTYKFVVTKPIHLSYTKNALVVAEDVAKNVTLKGGDISVNNTVDFDDLSAIIAAYATASTTADINGDGMVDFDDLSIIIANYQAASIVE